MWFLMQRWFIAVIMTVDLQPRSLSIFFMCIAVIQLGTHLLKPFNDKLVMIFSVLLNQVLILMCMVSYLSSFDLISLSLSVNFSITAIWLHMIISFMFATAVFG